MEELYTRKNKTYEELYGFDRAIEIKNKISNSLMEENHIKNKTYEERYGIEKAKEIKLKLSKRRKGKFYSEEWKKNMSIGMKKHKRTKEHCEKIRQLHLGKKRNESTKKKISETLKRKYKEGIITSPFALFKGKTYEERWGKNKADEMIKKISGENSCNWQGGKSFEPYTLDFNKKFKKSIINRDNSCMLCNINILDLKNIKRIIHIHHIDYNKLNNLKQNCITLCINCHMLTNSNRDYWKKFFQSLMKEKYNYDYSESKIILDLNNIYEVY